MKTRKRGGSLSLAYYKYKLEGKVDYGSGFYCERVEFLKLNTHTFLVLHGNDGVPNDTIIDGIKCCDDPTNNLTYYYLMTKNMLSHKPKCEDDSFLCKRTRVRFRNKPFSSVYVEHAYNSPTAKTCIAVCINDTKKEAEILNIRVNEKRCFIPNMDSTMKLIMELLEYKICHHDDLNKLKHLQGIKKNKSGVCKITQSSIMLRKLTYFFEFPINYIFYPFMIQRKPPNSLMGKIQSFIPVEYYNN